MVNPAHRSDTYQPKPIPFAVNLIKYVGWTLFVIGVVLPIAGINNLVASLSSSFPGSDELREGVAAGAFDTLQVSVTLIVVGLLLILIYPVAKAIFETRDMMQYIVDR